MRLSAVLALVAGCGRASGAQQQQQPPLPLQHRGSLVPQVSLLPRLSQAVEASSAPPQGANKERRVAVCTALDGRAAALFDQLFGACFSSGADDDTATAAHAPALRADFCAALARGAPSLLLLSGKDGGNPPIAALVAADVWFLEIPRVAESNTVALAMCDAALQRVLDALSVLPPAALHTRPPRQLLALVPPPPPPTDSAAASKTMDDETAIAAALQARLEALWAKRQPAVTLPPPSSMPPVRVGAALGEHLMVSVARVPDATTGRGGAEVLARFAQPSKAGYLLGGEGRLPSGAGLGDVMRCATR